MYLSKKTFTLLLLVIVVTFGAYAQDIHTASAKGDLEKVKDLLEKDPDLAKHKNQNYETPLILAAKYGVLFIITLSVFISKEPPANMDNLNLKKLHSVRKPRR
jgi:ankyrin repeat protein